MKKNIILLTSLCILSAFCGIISGILFFKTENNNLARAETTNEIENTPLPEITFQNKEEENPPEEAYVFESEQYVVTLSDTKIIIYKVSHDGSMQTVEEKLVDTGSIPREDYAKLYSGIIVTTLDEAKQIVEDFIS